MRAERLMPPKAAPDGNKALRTVEAYIRERGLQMSLTELVKKGADQRLRLLPRQPQQGCAQGWRERAALCLLDGWRESALYTPADPAALAWTDALTLVSKTHAPDDTHEALRSHFSDKQIVDLTILIGQINLWNRLAIRHVHEVDQAPLGR